MQPDIKTPPIVAAPAAPLLTYATPNELAIPQDWTSVEIFTLDPAQRKKYLQLVAGLLILIRLLLLTAVVLVMQFVVRADGLTIGVLIAVLCVFNIVGTVRAIFRIRRSWPSFRLTVADQGLITRSLTQPLTRVDASEIARITCTWDGYKITLRSRRHLTLSRRVLNLDALDAKLQKFQPVAAGAGALGTFGQIAFSWSVVIINVVFFYIGLFSPNPRTVLECAAFSVPIVLFTMWRVFRIKGLAVRTRVVSLLSILFPLMLLLHWVTLVYFKV